MLALLVSRFDVVAYHDFLHQRAKFKTGYRGSRLPGSLTCAAVHMQLVGRRLNSLGGDEYWRAPSCAYLWAPGDLREGHEWPLHGLSAEVQMLPAPVAAVQDEFRWVYEKWRKYQSNSTQIKGEQEGERAADFELMRLAYTKASDEWDKI
eukprot:TRINITY_DN13993_c0_g1_i4.p1 TRINITY_DN13993_c0_g1~~TRINITY_DN13993_c0_g1_i4.p1  ORF type:complete len:150 (-),score=19.93 TRINITY_DN13993_c0_g1_i4:61-510(-)